MSNEDTYRRKAEELLRLAAGADNMKDRGRLIDEAVRLHSLAMEAHSRSTAHANDDWDDSDDAWSEPAAELTKRRPVSDWPEG